MPQFHDLCLRETSAKIGDKAEELGWNSTNCDFNTVFLEADDWGALKTKIGENREEADVLVFKGGDEDLNRKAVTDSRLDVLLHPEKRNRDSGIGKAGIQEASENQVAIGFELQQLMTSRKKRSHILGHWRELLEMCERQGCPHILTTGAQDKLDLRPPRQLSSILDSLGFNGKKAVSDYPERILGRSEKVNQDGFVRPGEKR